MNAFFFVDKNPLFIIKITLYLYVISLFFHMIIVNGSRGLLILGVLKTPPILRVVKNHDPSSEIGDQRSLSQPTPLIPVIIF